MVLHGDLGERAPERSLGLAEHLPVFLGHDRVVAGVDLTHGGFPVPVGRAGDQEVALVGGDFVHPFPAHGQNAVRIPRGDRLGRFPEGGAAGGAARLDPDVAQGIQAETVVDEGLTEELVAEVVGEVPVVAGMDVPLELRRSEVDQLRRHG